MVFKLIRIDAQSPSKIQLSTGVHVIGRGKFLHNDDTDKRVSRNHAELEVTNDIVNLKALHQNPCFFIKNNTDETELLQQDCTISLCHGDRFGLIPDHFWYEVLHCHQDNEDIPKDGEGGTNGLHTEGVKDVADQNSKNSSDSATDSKETIHFENYEEDAVQNRSCSPSIMNDQESTDEYESKPQVPLDADKRTPVKRSNSSPETSPIDVKKVKTEPDDGVVSGAAVAGPSNGQSSSDSDGKTKDDDTSPANPNNVPSRERCMYGANCYRRNPQHLAQFSHPADADWGAGARGRCPYGRACSRRDPRHWDSHDHPPGTLPPHHHARRPGQTHKRRQRKTREVSDPEDSEEDSPARDLIVTGKRARKTIQQQDLEISESEREEDPFGTDESDEWQPPSDLTGSQDFSQAF